MAVNDERPPFIRPKAEHAVRLRSRYLGKGGLRPAPTPEEQAEWDAESAYIRAHPDIYENMLESVMSSMAFSGFHIDDERARRIFEKVLDGPALVIPEE